MNLGVWPFSILGARSAFLCPLRPHPEYTQVSFTQNEPRVGVGIPFPPTRIEAQAEASKGDAEVGIARVAEVRVPRRDQLRARQEYWF